MEGDGDGLEGGEGGFSVDGEIGVALAGEGIGGLDGSVVHGRRSRSVLTQSRKDGKGAKTLFVARGRVCCLGSDQSISLDAWGLQQMDGGLRS